MGCGLSRPDPVVLLGWETQDGFRKGLPGTQIGLTNCQNCQRKRKSGVNFDKEPFLYPCCFLKCTNCGKKREPGMAEGQPFHYPCAECG